MLSEARRTARCMNAIDDRVGTLEMRVERLETWAGPGQAESDVAELKRDVGELKVAVQEILRRLPYPPAD
jgi:hypothetical protein